MMEGSWEMKKGADITHLWDRNLTPTDIHISREIWYQHVWFCVHPQKERVLLYIVVTEEGRNGKVGKRTNTESLGGRKTHTHTHIRLVGIYILERFFCILRDFFHTASLLGKVIQHFMSANLCVCFYIFLGSIFATGWSNHTAIFLFVCFYFFFGKLFLWLFCASYSIHYFFFSFIKSEYYDWLIKILQRIHTSPTKETNGQQQQNIHFSNNFFSHPHNHFL